MTSTSDAQGYVYFEDLAAGTYTAVETTIPSGYQKAPVYENFTADYIILARIFA